MYTEFFTIGPVHPIFSSRGPEWVDQVEYSKIHSPDQEIDRILVGYAKFTVPKFQEVLNEKKNLLGKFDDPV